MNVITRDTRYQTGGENETQNHRKKLAEYKKKTQSVADVQDTETERK